MSVTIAEAVRDCTPWPIRTAADRSDDPALRRRLYTLAAVVELVHHTLQQSPIDLGPLSDVADALRRLPDADALAAWACAPPAEPERAAPRRRGRRRDAGHAEAAT